MTFHATYTAQMISFLTALVSLACTLSTGGYPHHNNNNHNNNNNNNNFYYHNFRIDSSSNNLHRSPTFSDLLKLQAVSNKIENLNFDQLSGEQSSDKFDFNDIAFLNRVTKYLKHVHGYDASDSDIDMTLSSIKNIIDNDEDDDDDKKDDIVIRDRTKSTKYDDNFDKFSVAQYSDRIPENASSLKIKSFQVLKDKQFVLQLLRGISKYRTNRHAYDSQKQIYDNDNESNNNESNDNESDDNKNNDNDITTSSNFQNQNSAESALFPTYASKSSTVSNPFTHNAYVDRLRRRVLLHVLLTKQAHASLAPRLHPSTTEYDVIAPGMQSPENSRARHLAFSTTRDESDGDSITHHTPNHEVVQTDKSPDNDGDGQFYDAGDYPGERRNHGDNNSNQNNGDDKHGGSPSRLEERAGDEERSETELNLHVPDKRDWRKKSRLMKYIRHRAGSVKGRKPLRLGVQSAGLRVSQKSRLRHKVNDGIVRREPLRQHLPGYGYPITRDASTGPQTTCLPDPDGFQPMRCRSNHNTCLHDAMLCDGKEDCLDGEDESMPICVMRHWMTKISRKIDSLSAAIRTG